MLPVDAEDYEGRAVATDLLDAFSDQLVIELDDNGGFTQWVGYSEWKTLTLLSDYLIQSVYGVSESLRLASFAARTHRDSTIADIEAMKSAAQQGRSPFPLNAQGRRRHLVITQSLEACFFHLGQALDRLTAAVVIVGGFEITATILPKARTTLSMGVYKALPDSFAKIHRRYLTPTTATITMGLVSIVFYVLFTSARTC